MIDTAYGYIETNQSLEAYSSSPEAVEAAVRTYFKDIPVMVQIARCESQFRHTLKDGSVLRGTVDPRDTGVMQINTGYHGERAQELGINIFSFEGNMEYARYLYEKQGVQPWSASAPCWERTLASR